ncbi:MAG: hypothetical protein KA988_05275 [Longilinea sp.]|nr:hypothetical protein [Longilinea sp.]MCA1953626.1 reverse transcriptase/maturase family protein [Anaerolinea sp.]
MQPTLWQQLTSFLNLRMAFEQAARGKRSHAAVASFEFDLEENLLRLRDELRSASYQPGEYVNFWIHDPKRRLISAAPFRDRVVHHALCNVIQPLWERRFVYDSYANRVGKGTHKALDRATQYLRRFRYVLPLDVRKFFPSVDHAILLQQLQQGIRDEDVLDLCARILRGGEGVLATEYEMVYFPGDDLLAAIRPRGLPIGNLTSQFWANVYLNGLDHFIKRRLGVGGYVRYVDDMLLFGDDLRQMHMWRQAVIRRLADLRLTVHEGSAQPRPCAIGIPFLGFQVFPSHRRLKRRKVVQFRRRLRTGLKAYWAGERSLQQMQASIQGWIHHAQHGDTWGLRMAMLRSVVL